jgi:hypothetical protein
VSRDYIGVSVSVKLRAINFMSGDLSMITFEHVLKTNRQRRQTNGDKL